MFTKLVALIVLGAIMSLTTPNQPVANPLAEEAPTALFSICLGPMTVGFATRGGLVNIGFDAFSHGEGHAGLLHGHTSAQLNPFKTRPSGGALAQTLPNRLPVLH